MAYKLIIAEKPSVAKEIAKIVGATTRQADGPCGYIEGNGYKVSWAFGHLVGLKTPEQMGFASGELPMFPEKWETRVLGKKGKDGKDTVDPMVEKQMKNLDRLVAGCDEIIVATDAGREGELIFRYIYEHLESRKPFSRLWISSLTDEAIRKGMKELRPGNEMDALSAAAHQRSQSDWLVGYNASRALRLSTGYRGNLSLGRVQTPVLGMICERYRENKEFKPVPYWMVEAAAEKGIAFKARTLDRKEGEEGGASARKYDNEKDACSDRNAVIAGKTLSVVSVQKKQVTAAPPLLHDLTSLQRAANSKYGLTAQQTLDAAQGLYEKKVMTYPRTGSRYIPDDVFKTIPALLKRLESHPAYGKDAKAIEGVKLCHKSVNADKVTDHHALLPTGNTPEGLNSAEQKVYDLVVAQTIRAFGETYVGESTTVLFDGGTKEHPVKLFSRGSVPVKMGWKGVGEDEDNGKENDEDQDETLPSLTKGDVVAVTSCDVLAKETKPKPIYTDSSLIGEMETCGKSIDDEAMREAMKDVGLGTPATRAATIEGLIKRGYVDRSGKKLLPTDFGLQVWDMVKGRRIADVQTTGEWERDLALVEQGKFPEKKFESGIKAFVKEIIDDLQANCKPLEIKEETYTCPICGKTMKGGKFSIYCSTETGGCGLKIYRTIAEKKLPDAAIKALLAGKRTAEVKGLKSKSGKTFSAAFEIDREKKCIKYAFDERPAGPQMTGRICPCCGKELKDEPSVLSCDCGLKIWKNSLGVQLTQKQIDAILSGETVQVKGMKSPKTGKVFDAGVRLNKEEKKTDFVFDNSRPFKKPFGKTGKSKKKK